MTEHHVVFAHGLWMPGLEMAPLQQRLRRDHGIIGTLFSYPTIGGSLDDNARLLAAAVRAAASPVDALVGHSLGGIVALRAAYVDNALSVRRIVCLGSPLAGSRAARALDRNLIGRQVMGHSVRAAAVAARTRDWAPAVLRSREVGVIAGKTPAGLGRLLAGFREPNDGTVAVAETLIDGLADHIVLPVSHTGLVLSAEVAAQCAAFIEGGKFLRAP